MAPYGFKKIDPSSGIEIGLEMLQFQPPAAAGRRLGPEAGASGGGLAARERAE
jgi:hypothetical protein